MQGKASCRSPGYRQPATSVWSCPSSRISPCRSKSSTSTCSSSCSCGRTSSHLSTSRQPQAEPGHTISQVLGVGGSGAPPAGRHNVPFSVPTVAKGEKVCQVCKRTFWSSSRLRVHMRSHSKTGPKCVKCGKQFTTKAGLRTHLESCVSAGTHICAVCGKRFKSDKSLQAHNADHLAPAGGLPCQYCGSNFKNSRILKDHDSRDCAKSPSYAGPFYCLAANCSRAQGCGDPFRQVKDHNAHMPWVHNYK